MNKLIKNIYWYGLKKILIPYSKQNFGNSLSIFNFHQVTPYFDKRFHSRGTWTNLAHFKNQINFIKSNFRIISLEDGINRTENNQLDDKYAAVTFDDGDISFQQFVYPYLVENKIHSTIFINSAYLDSGKASWYAIFRYLVNDDHLRGLIPDNILDLDLQLRNTTNKDFYEYYSNKINVLIDRVPKIVKFYIEEIFLKNVNLRFVNIGLHGHEHHRYSMLERQIMREDIINNVKVISQFKGYLPFFALPFGKPTDWNTDTIKILLENKLKIFLHNGGINLHQEATYKRIPSDNININDVYYKNYFCTH